MLDEILANLTWMNFFAAFVLYILSIFIGVFLKRNPNTIIPLIFGLTYGSYIAYSSYINSYILGNGYFK